MVAGWRHTLSQGNPYSRDLAGECQRRSRTPFGCPVGLVAGLVAGGYLESAGSIQTAGDPRLKQAVSKYQADNDLVATGRLSFELYYNMLNKGLIQPGGTVASLVDISEIREAALAVREVAGDEIVIVAQVTIDDEGMLPEGGDADTFTTTLDDLPVDVIGLNCSVGPKAMLDTLERMAQLTTKPLSVMPNAGKPVSVEGRNIYLCSPEYMSQYARRYVCLLYTSDAADE